MDEKEKKPEHTPLPWRELADGYIGADNPPHKTNKVIAEKELLELNRKLIDLGNDLVSAIEKYGRYSKYGMSPRMEESIRKWKLNIEKNYIKHP